MTENHGYQTPQKGTTDWHLPLNDNFAQLDRDVEIRDVESNRSNYRPKQNAKFFATDTGATFIGDGSQWKQVKVGNDQAVDAVSVMADGSTRKFSLSHTLGTVPSAVFVQPRNEAASAGFWTNPDNHTDSSVEIVYSAAPAAETTLEYVVMTVK